MAKTEPISGGNRDQGDRSGSKSDMANPKPNLVRFFGFLAAIGVLASAGYSAQFDLLTFVKVMGFAVIVGGAAALTAGVLGFVFGLPSTILPGREAGAPDGPRYLPNNSLEQISDWITKIIVGIGLVQIGRVSGALASLARRLRPGFAEANADQGALEAAGTFSIALVIYAGLAGFLAAFLWARLSLPGQFRLADVVDELDKRRLNQEEHDAWALTIVERALSPDLGGSPPTPEEIKEAIRQASAPVLVQIFNRARASRRENEAAGNREAVARIVPIFKALIAHDRAARFHRNHAQLAYALKASSDVPPHEEIIAELTKAISVRGHWRKAGFILYELNRALSRIEADPSFKRGEKSPEAVRNEIVADLQVSRSSQGLRRSISSNETIRRWLQLNQVDLA